MRRWVGSKAELVYRDACVSQLAFDDFLYTLEVFTDPVTLPNRIEPRTRFAASTAST